MSTRTGRDAGDNSSCFFFVLLNGIRCSFVYCEKEALNQNELFFVQDIFIQLTSVAACGSSTEYLTFEIIKQIHSSYVCIID